MLDAASVGGAARSREPAGLAGGTRALTLRPMFMSLGPMARAGSMAALEMDAASAAAMSALCRA